MVKDQCNCSTFNLFSFITEVVKIIEKVFKDCVIDNVYGIYYISHQWVDKPWTWKEVTMAKQLKDNFRDLTFCSNFLTQQKYHKENLVWLLFMWWRQLEKKTIWNKLCQIAAKFI